MSQSVTSDVAKNETKQVRKNDGDHGTTLFQRFQVPKRQVSVADPRVNAIMMNKAILLALLSAICFQLASTVLALSSQVLGRRTKDTEKLFSAHFPDGKKDIKNSVALTYLEINGYLMTAGGVTILIDPILEGQLDFGIPDLYRAKKKTLPAAGLTETLPPIDCLLITQGLDDHAHVRTLKKLAGKKNFQSIPILAPPSAKPALEAAGLTRNPNLRFLRHGEKATIFPAGEDLSTDDGVSVCATIGALVGPPWQARENGHIIRSKTAPSVYIEPHVEFFPNNLRKEGTVDIAITPITGQTLPAFELVHGPSDTVRLLNVLQPKVLVPMRNGNLDTDGPISPIIRTIGSTSEFQSLLKKADITPPEFLEVIPGVDHIISC